MFNQVELLKGLQEKSDELGISKGDLVQLGTLAIIKTENEKLRKVIENIRCIPVRGAV